MAKARIQATWEVSGGACAEDEIEVTGLTFDQIAQRVDGLHPGISLCHQCSDQVDDLQLGDLVSFTVDGRTFDRDGDGRWSDAAVSDGQ